MEHQELIQELNLIAKRSENQEGFSKLIDYINKCFSPDTPSHEIGTSRLGLEFQSCRDYVRPEDKESYISLDMQAINFLREMGYRTSSEILTPQEHNLFGSDVPKNNEPYKPFGLITGELTLEEAIKARELTKTSFAFTPKYYHIKNHDEDFVTISLESLDKDGNTIRDPQPLDENLNPISNYKKSDKFPFRRD